MRLFKVILLIACLAIPFTAQAVQMNEIRIDQPGSDVDEYFELIGTPGESLNGLTYIVIGDGATASGTIENVTPLDGFVVAADGYFLFTEASFTGTCGDGPDAIGSINFENSDNVTHMLVSGFTGANGDDLDVDDDGILDATPWSSIVDSVAFIEDLALGDKVYSSTQVGPDGPYVPGHILICDGYWVIGDFGACVNDSPGISNADVCAVPEEKTSFGSLKSMFK